MKQASLSHALFHAKRTQASKTPGAFTDVDNPTQSAAAALPGTHRSAPARLARKMREADPIRHSLDRRIVARVRASCAGELEQGSAERGELVEREGLAPTARVDARPFEHDTQIGGRS